MSRQPRAEAAADLWLKFRVTDPERALAHRVAAARGVNVSALFRAWLLADAAALGLLGSNATTAPEVAPDDPAPAAGNPPADTSLEVAPDAPADAEPVTSVEPAPLDAAPSAPPVALPDDETECARLALPLAIRLPVWRPYGHGVFVSDVWRELRTTTPLEVFKARMLACHKLGLLNLMEASTTEGDPADLVRKRHESAIQSGAVTFHLIEKTIPGRWLRVT